MEKTYFITFEGIDGSGKDTQLFELVKAIKNDDNFPFGNKYSNIWVTRNPTKITQSGRKVSNLIRKGSIDGKTAARLYIQDRIEHSRIIRQFLRYSHVLSSRYDISTLTYQYVQGIDFDELYNAHNFGKSDGCVIPDISVVFEIPAEISFKRISKRGEKREYFEELDFQKKLVEAQRICVEKLRERGRKIIVVNANQEIEKVKDEMLGKIYELINNELV